MKISPLSVFFSVVDSLYNVKQNSTLHLLQPVPAFYLAV